MVLWFLVEENQQEQVNHSGTMCKRMGDVSLSCLLQLSKNTVLSHALKYLSQETEPTSEGERKVKSVASH